MAGIGVDQRLPDFHLDLLFVEVRECGFQVGAGRIGFADPCFSQPQQSLDFPYLRLGLHGGLQMGDRLRVVMRKVVEHAEIGLGFRI